ncbi:MAG TPA: DegV family protein [Candidatus Pullichristensenella avicola]|nr:DegV family protein [Candidatus Pullichristensenella avicola]
MVKISADSTCDLSPELQKRYNVTIQPLYIVRDGDSLRDGVEIRSEDIFAYVEKTGKLLKTAAVSVEDYLNLFRRLTQDGSEVVHVTISSEMSACYQNACLAAREVPGVYPVDSRNLSTGMGLVVIEAARRAQAGEGGAQIQKAMDELTARVEASFVIERLDYLYKGGRCSALAALGANLLHMKPCIEVRNGKMGVGKKYRGAYEKVLRQYAYDRLHGRSDIARDRAFITWSTCPEPALDAVRAVCREEGGFDELLETQAGCTICNHCGPNTLGVLFIRK